MRRLAIGLLLVSGLLSGCTRPKLPAKDAADPAAVPPPPPPASAPAPAPPAAQQAPPSAQSTNVVAPAEGAVLAAGAPLELRVEYTGEQKPAGFLVFLDRQPPRLLASAGESLSLASPAPGAHFLAVVPLDEVGMMLEATHRGTRSFSVAQAAPAAVDPAGPMLLVGSPYDPVALRDTGEVPFDLRVDGVALAEDGAKVHWRVDDGEEEWLAEYPPAEPLSLGRLEPGKHSLAVWLVGADGKPLENGGFTRVERAFTVPAEGGAG